MSAIRAFGPRIIRPQLSNRYQVIRRFESSSSATSVHPSTPLPPRPSFFRRKRAAIIWSTVAFLLGLSAGNVLRESISPPNFPAPGTPEDQALLADLNQHIDEEFKVKIFRGKCLGVSKQLKGAPGGWVEIVPAPTGDQKIAEDGLIDHMQGMRGLGVERVFWDRDEQKLVAIIWVGGSLVGWPGVTHGGVLATLLTEKLALAAALAEDRDHAFSAAAVPQRMPGTGSHAKAFAPASKPAEPAQLSLTYKKPAHANTFYVVRVNHALPASDADHLTLSDPRAGHEYEAVIETLDAKPCVLAKARFTPDTTAQKVEERVIGGAQKSYAEFRDWMWPSRQKSSRIA